MAQVENPTIVPRKSVLNCSYSSFRLQTSGNVLVYPLQSQQTQSHLSWHYSAYVITMIERFSKVLSGCRKAPGMFWIGCRKSAFFFNKFFSTPGHIVGNPNIVLQGESEFVSVHFYVQWL